MKPEAPQVPNQPQALLRCSTFAQPRMRRTQILALGIQPVEPLPLAYLDWCCGLLGQRRKELGMPLTDCRLFAARRKLLPSVVANRLKHPEARFAVGLRSLLHQTLIQQSSQLFKNHAAARHTPRFSHDHCLGRIEGPTIDKDGELAKQTLLVRRKQVDSSRQSQRALSGDAPVRRERRQ